MIEIHYVILYAQIAARIWIVLIKETSGMFINASKKFDFVSRKAILFIDNSSDCVRARKLLVKSKIDFVEYNFKEILESGCCGEGFTTKAPSIFAPEGIFRGIDGIKKYVKIRKSKKQIESESAYW